MVVTTFSPEEFKNRELVTSLRSLMGRMPSLTSVTDLQAMHDVLKIAMWNLVALSTAAGFFSAGFQLMLQIFLCGFGAMVALHAFFSLFLLLYSTPVRWK